MAGMGRFSPGELVSARGRDWIVLPIDAHDALRLRPLTGSPTDETIVFEPLEAAGTVRLATFPLPDPMRLGDVTGLGTPCS